MLALLIAGTLLIKLWLEHRAALPFPVSGTTEWFVDQPSGGSGSMLRVRAPASHQKNYAVRLDDWEGHRPVLVIFVRGGEDAITPLPLGRYRVTIASGFNWLGGGKYFGLRGDVREVLTPLEFYSTGHSVINQILEVERPMQGNLETRPVLGF